MSNAPTRRLLKTLTTRLASQRAELETCTTAAMVRCVKEAIADTGRQLTEAGSR